jgi:hypothetical protein
VFKNVFLKASNILHWLPQVRAAVFIGIGSNLCRNEQQMFLMINFFFEKSPLFTFKKF